MISNFLTVLCIILTFGLWWWAIVDIVRLRFNNKTLKIIVLLVVIFFPILGSILYFQFKKRLIQKRRFQPNFK